MSRPSREYWESRFAALEALAYGEGTLIYADIEKAYRRAVKDVEKDIALWFLLFSDDEISYSEATKYLTSKELANFKMDVNDYIKSASSVYISTSWAKQLEKVAARHRITRLEWIMVQLQQHLEKLFGKQEQLLSEGLARIYNDTYYETAFEVFKGYGIGHEFAGVNTDKLEEVLKKPWAPDGSNFSDRVWKHKDVLVNTLAQEMTGAVIRGDDYKTATDNIAEKMNVSRRAAGRLVYTESAYFASKSAINSFKELGVEKYEFIATLDRRTSRTCRNFDGKIFPVKDYKPGRNAPPMHCHCRSHIMPYLEDAREEERVARGSDGKIYYVPGNMKYKDWKSVYVDKTISLEEWKKKNPNTGLQKSDEGNIINLKEDVEQAKTRDKKIPITDAAVDKVNLLNIPTFTQAQNRTIQLECKATLLHAKENNNSNEVLNVLSMKDNISVKVKGNQGSANIGSNPFAVNMLRSAGRNELTFIHNHPGTSIFSIQDILTFVGHSSIGSMLAVTNQGRCFALSKNKDYNFSRVKDILNLLKGISSQKAVKEFLKQCPKGGVDYVK